MASRMLPQISRNFPFGSCGFFEVQHQYQATGFVHNGFVCRVLRKPGFPERVALIVGVLHPRDKERVCGQVFGFIG